MSEQGNPDWLKRFGDPMDAKREEHCPIVPTRDYIVMRKVSKAKLGAIHLTDGSSVEARLEVLAVGPDVQHLKIGDHVIPNPQYMGKAVVAAVEYCICQEEDIPGIFADSRGLTVSRPVAESGDLQV